MKPTTRLILLFALLALLLGQRMAAPVRAQEQGPTPADPPTMPAPPEQAQPQA